MSGRVREGKLKVLIITQTPLWSIAKQSGGPALSRAVFGYAEAGHTVHVVAPRLSYVRQSDLPPGVVLHTFRHFFHGYLVHRRKVGWVFDSLGWVVFQVRAYQIARRLLSRQRFDVIYGYNVWGVPCARRLADRFDLPLVSRFQGTFAGRFIGAPLADLRLFKYFTAFRTPADLYIMTDDGSRGDEVLRHFGAKEEKIRFWRNGVEIHRVEGREPADLKEEFDVGASQWMLLTLCRLVPYKGVARVIGAMPAVLERFPGCKLVVVGEGPQRPELETLVADLKIGGSVHFAGGLDRGGVARAMTAADVFISMYDHSNVGNPLFEAMSCAKPIVTLNTGATGDIVEDDVNGILLGAPELDSLAGAICRLLADDSLRERLGSQARHWAETNLQSWEQRIEMEIEEITNLVERWQAAG